MTNAALQQEVIARMREMPALIGLPIDDLASIPLGKLRRNATNLQAVCRYHRGVRKADGGITPADVRTIDVHPYAMEADWTRYAAFLLFHEYLHALGFAHHDRTFRALEALWPDAEARAMGPAFATHLRLRAAKWLWRCTQCGRDHPRQRRSGGRYRCRTCEVPLIDVPTSPEH